MTCALFEHFEAGYMEDNDYMRNYECTVIKEAEIFDQHIYLNAGVTTYHPVTDIYTEIRYMRANDHTLRVVEPFVTAQGNVPKGGGKFTARLAVINDPWKIIPDPDGTILKVTGEQISNIGTSGAALINFTEHTPGVSIAVEYAPADTEVIQLGGTAGTPAEVATAVRAELTTELAEVSDTNTKVQNIAADVWDVSKANLVTSGSVGEFLIKQVVTLKEWYSK